MGLFDSMKETLSVTSQGVAQKVSNATESAKLSNQIKANRKMIEKILYQVGKKCFEVEGNNQGTPYDEMFQEIHRLQDENSDFLVRIEVLSTEKSCPKCGHQNSGDSKFCVSCGAFLEAEKDLSTNDSGSICAYCGEVNAEDAIFCAKCGNKLDKQQEKSQ